MRGRLPEGPQRWLLAVPLAGPELTVDSQGTAELAGGVSGRAWEKHYLRVLQQCSLHLKQPLDACPDLCLQTAGSRCSYSLQDIMLWTETARIFA